MRRRLTIREMVYVQDLKEAAKKDAAEKLRLALELSDFCRYLQNKISIKKEKYGIS